MSPVSKRILLGVTIIAIAAGAYVGLRGSPDAKKPKSGNAVQTVRIAPAQQKTLRIEVRANGYVTALNSVEVRPQVQNIVRAIHVKEGQDVRAGQLLFTLDERGDASNVDRARAQVARDQADLADAEAALKRNQELQRQGFVAQAVVDTARNRVDALRSAMQADVAAVRSSGVALGFNRIVASIDGRLGLINAHPGSLAQPSGTPLVTIAQLDPIAVSFSVSEQDRAHIAASYPKGDAPVTAQLPGGEEVEGKLSFIDNSVDAQTGSIRMKAQFANPGHKMWPGGFVNVRLVSRTLPDVVAVPAQAVVTGPNEEFVYVVQPDNSVKMQKVAVSAIEEGQAAVRGIAAGTRIVVEGMQNLRPNSKVKEAAPEAAGRQADTVAKNGNGHGKTP
jgi:RND family efflux transporter MFP subunit